MKRKVLSVMLCAAMVVSMTACGGSDAKENTASANASVSETEQGEATDVYKRQQLWGLERSVPVWQRF